MSVELVVTYKDEEQVLRVEDSDVIEFPIGLVGFPEWRRFVLLEDPEEAPVAVLQCIDYSEVSFLVTDPAVVCPGYGPTVGPIELSELGVDSISEARLLCILVVKEGPVLATANLLGPILINPRSREARQVVLQDSTYSAQHPVLVSEGATAGIGS